MEQTSKTGLVVEGGGMKCVYSAGILDAFLDEQISFDYCIGVSGGAGNTASYLAGQRGRNLRFYAEHIHSADYFGLISFLKTGFIFGLPYIYGTLTNSGGKDPLDFPALMKNPTQYEVVATNALTGQPEYFPKEKMQQDHYLEIMASCAIPVACRPIEINGIPYFDGGISDSIPIHRAFAQGCTKLVVILSKPRSYVRHPQGMRFLYATICRNYPKIVDIIDHRHAAYNDLFQEILRLEQEGKIFLFAPSGNIHVGTYSMKEETERALYAEGLADFAARKEELKAFLAK